MVSVTYMKCPKCEKNFYIHKDLYKTDFKPICPFCQHAFKQEESPDVWDISERRGWQARKMGS